MIKPLYHHKKYGRFLFACHFEALHASDRFDRWLSFAALHSYLAFGAVSEPAPVVHS